MTGNSFPPEILSGNVNERIPESTKFGVTVATVTASDRDTQFPDNDIRFVMFAVKPTLDFFAIEIETGNIFLKKDLTTDISPTYQVIWLGMDIFKHISYKHILSIVSLLYSPSIQYYASICKIDISVWH